MHDKLNISFQHSECPEENILKAYHNNSLSKPEVRKVELHLADCEMCSDYLEGLSLLSGTGELDNEAAFVVTEINKDRSKKNRLWLYATAASVLLAISIFTFIWFLPVKNNFVAQEVKEELRKSEDLPAPADSLDTGINKLYKNSTEAVSGGDIKDIRQEQQQVTTIVDATGETTYMKTADIAEKETPLEDGYLSWNQKTPGETDKNIVAETKSETILTSKLDEDQSKVTVTGVNQNLRGGVATDASITPEEEKSERSNKSDKKNNRESTRQKDSKTVADEVAASEQSPVLISRNETPAKETNIDDIENTESNNDLDKAKVFYRQQMADSAVFYALRATVSCDSCKWSALLLLSKSYLYAGQTEKAVATLKEVKSKGPSKFAKEAKQELEKLGY